jgi:amidohydrolase
MRNNISDKLLEKVITLRKKLHSQPELANDEVRTANTIKEFVQQYSPDEIIENIGGNGIAFIFKYGNTGPTIMIRAELDALPIEEVNNFNYRSLKNGISHKCGHDGHMAILSGLAAVLQSSKPMQGRVVLLFQPAEEIGEGANQVIHDPKFNLLKPDFIFALHNLPDFEKHEIIIRENIFAAASTGMVIKLFGKTSHAAHPEDGISPAIAVSKIIQRFNDALKKETPENFDFGLITIIHINLGEKAFGTSPGYAEVLATLRAFTNKNLEFIKSKCAEIVDDISNEQLLKTEINWTEEFPATNNNLEAVEIIKKSASSLNLNLHEIKTPFRWTEDFGHFTKISKSAFFGLGAGKKTPQLHNPDYDFPDDLIPTGINMFEKIIHNILDQKY